VEYVSLPPPQRTWTKKIRLEWWAKYIGMVSGTLAAIALMAKLLGLHFDVQSASQTREQIETVRLFIQSEDNRVRAEQSEALRELKDSIKTLTSRIDNAMADRRRRN
jgi:hypothetical protein